MSIRFRAFTLALTLLLAACAVRPVPPPEPVAPARPAPIPPPPAPIVAVQPPSSPVGANALLTGFTVQPAKLLLAEEAIRALAAFRTSCAALLGRNDASGLTQASDWQPLCDEVRTLDPVHAAGFFFHRFDWVRIGDGRAFATGYYEPEIEGSRVPLPNYIPIHGLPNDLVRCTRSDGTAGRGRIDGSGRCVSFHSRGEIHDGALSGRGLEIAWAKDPVELFFLEIQGSGRVRMPDGSVMRIGYAGQNGRDYVAVGKLLRDRGIFAPGQATMQSIKDWIRANPEAGKALMRENLSYIFFRELTGPGPLGAMGVAVTPKGSVAADPKYVPLGAPVHLILDRADASGLWVAQDTGGAIKGANRFDTFWGAGEQAVVAAGGLTASGSALLLLPKSSVARALARR
ncbi:MAG: murein transglycosylase A [Sphingomicrobium sp.]